MSRIGSTIRSAKMNASTPPKEMPPFQRTAASGTFPIEQTKLRTATSGPISGPQNLAKVGRPWKKSACHHELGTQAASAPAISSPPTRSRRIAAHSITNTFEVEVKPSGEASRCRIEPRALIDMSINARGSILHRLASPEGFTSTSNVFVMEWAAILRDLVGGLLIAGALAAWVPNSWWQALFFHGRPTFAKFWGPLIGPLVAVLSFVCSIGNVPLAAVLWNGGISFGGVLAFIFADLIILPILDIYRRYYGWKMMWFLLLTFYLTMVAAGLAVELLFQVFGIERHT